MNEYIKMAVYLIGQIKSFNEVLTNLSNMIFHW